MYAEIEKMRIEIQETQYRLLDQGETGKDIYYLQGKIDACREILDMIESSIIRKKKDGK